MIYAHILCLAMKRIEGNNSTARIANASLSTQDKD